MCNFASPLCSRKQWSLFFGNFVYVFANHLCCRVTHQDIEGHKGRETPSVAGIINPGFEGFQKLFFGQEEITIPVHSNIEASCAAHPTADVLINFASYRTAATSSMAAIKQPTIRVVAIIAEGVPELDTKQLIIYARANKKVVIGPATVGGIQAGAFKIGDTAGTIVNIIHCKLYRPGSVGFVSKSVCS
ncbi:unnamed protein product [Malus baccata var. baccata]